MTSTHHFNRTLISATLFISGTDEANKTKVVILGLQYAYITIHGQTDAIT